VQHYRRRRGFVLLTSAIAMIGLLLLVGLATDVGRVFVARNELQVFVDEAAIAATFELDGTTAGLARARDAAAAGPGTAPNRWNFGTQAVTSVSTQFSTAPNGPFEDAPAIGTNYRFIKVRATAATTLYFLPLAPGIPDSQSIAVSAIAGQTPMSALGNGLCPFSPTAHDPNAADFGFTSGQLYTLRWAPSGQRDKAGGSCAGDVGFDPGGSDDRGYVDVGQGTGASALRDTIVNNSFFLPTPLHIGSMLNMLSGQESVPSAVQQRFDQDTDVSAPNLAGYNGNGRRLITVVINGGGDPSQAVGFGLFFLQPTPCGTKNTTPCCAEYVGSAVLSSRRRGAGVAGVYKVQLVE
jgi:Flp pilus assembly protein TadG